MRYFIDSEFSQPTPRDPIELISIGIVADDERELYLVSEEFVSLSGNAFVQEVVVPLLPSPSERVSLATIRTAVRAFIEDFPDFIGQCAAFDYVVLSNLMGTFDQWPRHWPHYIEDIQFRVDIMAGRMTFPVSSRPHHALADAQAVRETFYALAEADWESYQ